MSGVRRGRVIKEGLEHTRGPSKLGNMLSPSPTSKDDPRLEIAGKLHECTNTKSKTFRGRSKVGCSPGIGCRSNQVLQNEVRSMEDCFRWDKDDVTSARL